MRTLIFVLVVLAAIGGVGFYRGWFSFASHKVADKSNITLTVDEDKIKGDKKKATQEVEDLGHSVKNKVAGSSEKSH